MFLPVVTIAHELAHALAARIVGGQVNVIKLGLTQNPDGPHFAFRLLDFNWHLYAVPLSGSVHHYYPTNPDYFRSKIIFISAAGALANLLMATLAIPALLATLSPPCTGLWIGWGVANLLFVLLTLNPIAFTSKKGALKSDGANIVAHLSASEEELAERRQSAKLLRMLAPEKEIMSKLSADEAFARYEAYPDNPATLILLVDKLTEAKDPRQFGFVEKLIANPTFLSKNIATFLDAYLTNHLSGTMIRDHPCFDSFSQRLVDLGNGSISVLGTRGAVLIDLGRIEEGNALLKKVLAESKNPIDKFYSNVFLALSAQREGQLDLAVEYALAAQKLDPGSAVLKRLDPLLSHSRKSARSTSSG